jgi:hypothetical protein
MLLPVFHGLVSRKAPLMAVGEIKIKGRKILFPVRYKIGNLQMEQERCPFFYVDTLPFIPLF